VEQRRDLSCEKQWIKLVTIFLIALDGVIYSCEGKGEGQMNFSIIQHELCNF
jgi:hypothetical protein